MDTIVVLNGRCIVEEGTHDSLMARMVHNGIETCVMEVSSHALVQGRCDM